MNSSSIRKVAAILSICMLGVNLTAPYCDLSAAASSIAVSHHEDPERFRNRNSEVLSEAVQSPWELVHDPRFDGCEKLDCIDVSSHQGVVDWDAVAADGVQAAILRLGYRGYETGNLNEDQYFRSNLEGAYRAGLRVGVYFYTQAVNTMEAVDEANFVADTLASMPHIRLTLPVFYDMEKIDYDHGRMDAMNFSPADHTALCEAFCSTIQTRGYEAGVYSNKNFMVNDLLMTSLEQYHIWLANYTSQTSYTGKYDYWQYTQSSFINGVDGTVDRSVIYLTAGNELPAQETKEAAAGETVQDPTEAATAATEFSLFPVLDPAESTATEQPTASVNTETMQIPTFVPPTENTEVVITPISQQTTDPTEPLPQVQIPTFVPPTENTSEVITPISQQTTDPVETISQITTLPVFDAPTEQTTETLPQVEIPTFVPPTENTTDPTETAAQTPLPTENPTDITVTPIEELLTEPVETPSDSIPVLRNCTKIVFCKLGEQAKYAGNVPSGEALYSSNPAVFTVDSNGVLKAVGSGSATLCCGSSVICNVEVPAAAPQRGDCNLDGYINAADATYILQYASCLGTGNAPDLTASHFELFDFNGDKVINSSDASEILRYSASKGVGL